MVGRRERQPPQGVVERAQRIVVCRRPVEADVIVMSADGDVLALQLRIAARQNGDHVAGRSGHVDERYRAVHRLSGRTRPHAVERGPEQQPGTGGIHVHIGGQADRIGGSRRVAHDRLRLTEKVDRLRRECFQCDHRDARSGAIAREQRAAIHLCRLRKIRAAAHGDHDEFSGCLLRRQHRTVAQHAGERRWRAVESPCRAPRIARHEIVPRLERRTLDREARIRIELSLDERHVLEVTAGIARGQQPEALHFRRDVRGGFEIVFAAGQPAHHRIVRVEVQTSHEVRRRDRRLRACRRVLQR